MQALTVSGSLVYRLGSPKDQRLAFNMDLKNPLAAVASIGAGVSSTCRSTCTENVLKLPSLLILFSLFFFWPFHLPAQFAANILKADSVKKAIGFIPLIDVDQHLEVVVPCPECFTLP